MGIFNVIKLANDYNKAKKMLKNKDVDIKKLINLYGNMTTRLHEFVEYFEQLFNEGKKFIKECFDLLDRLKDTMGKIANKGE